MGLVPAIKPGDWTFSRVAGLSCFWVHLFAAHSRDGCSFDQTKQMGAAWDRRGAGSFGVLGRCLACGAPHRQEPDPEDREREAWPAGHRRQDRFQALDTRAHAERPAHRHRRRQQAAGGRRPHLRRRRTAVHLPSRPGDRHGHRRRAGYPAHAPGRRQVRHRRHPGQALGRPALRPERQARALRHLQHRDQRRLGRLRRPDRQAQARVARLRAQGAVPQQPRLQARHQHRAQAGLRA